MEAASSSFNLTSFRLYSYHFCCFKHTLTIRGNARERRSHLQRFWTPAFRTLKRVDFKNAARSLNTNVRSVSFLTVFRPNTHTKKQLKQYRRISTASDRDNSPTKIIQWWPLAETRALWLSKRVMNFDSSWTFHNTT